MNIHTEIAFFESRQPVSLPAAPWFSCDPRIVDLDPSDWFEINPVAAIQTGAFAPKGGR